MKPLFLIAIIAVAAVPFCVMQYFMDRYYKSFKNPPKGKPGLPAWVKQKDING